MELAQDERPNLDVALQRANVADPVAGLKLLELVEMYWITNDPLGARERIDALLAVAGEELDPAVHGRALRFRGATFDMTGHNDLAGPDYVKAIDLFRDAGDEEEVTHLTVRLAFGAIEQGDLDRGRRLATDALEVARGRGSRREEGVALNALAKVAFSDEDAAEGLRLAREAADAAEAAGQIWWRGVTLFGACEDLLALGEHAAAQPLFSEGLELLRSVHDLVNLPIALATGAALAAREGDSVRAGTLWGAVEAEAERAPKETTAATIAHYEPYLEPVRGDDFETARTRGHTLSLEDAVAYALGP